MVKFVFCNFPFGQRDKLHGPRACNEVANRLARPLQRKAQQLEVEADGGFMGLQG